MSGQFNTNLRDSQSVGVIPIMPERFDFDAYAEYEAALLPGNRKFECAESGIQVYRRFRADGVFFDKCKDYRESLSLQLGALSASMDYKADIANFLEPWYGIGYIASSFGADYIWAPGQAPEVEHKFASCEEILAYDAVPIKDTPIGGRILETIEYFLEKTKGKLPVSFSDVQSPLNMMSYLLPTSELFMELYVDPDGVREVAGRVTDLLADFLAEQYKLIGNALVYPGHGFASSKAFRGLGASDDMSLMVSPDQYADFFMPHDERLGDLYGGFSYHSCGNWASKIQMVKNYRNIICVDGAFGPETDPSPNNAHEFADGFSGSGIRLNARVVGDAENVYEVFKELFRPELKLVAVTYCATPEEQAALYDKLHGLEIGGNAL